MNEPVPPAAPPPPARYGLPQAAGETLFLVGLSMVGLLAIHLPVVGPFATHLSMAAAALLLLYQAGMKVTWLPPSGSWRPFVRPTLLAAVLLLPLAAGYVHAELTAAAPRDPVAWRAAMEQLAARMAAVPFWATAGMFVRLGVVVPMAEELAFRGYLHSRLLRHDARRWQLGQLAWSRAALVSAGLFSVSHVVNYAFKPAPLWLVAGHLGSALVFGVVAAVLLERTGSLLVPTVLHGVVNVGAGLYRMGLVAYLAAHL